MIETVQKVRNAKIRTEMEWKWSTVEMETDHFLLPNEMKMVPNGNGKIVNYLRFSTVCNKYVCERS